MGLAFSFSSARVAGPNLLPMCVYMYFQCVNQLSLVLHHAYKLHAFSTAWACVLFTHNPFSSSFAQLLTETAAVADPHASHSNGQTAF